VFFLGVLIMIVDVLGEGICLWREGNKVAVCPCSADGKLPRLYTSTSLQRTAEMRDWAISLIDRFSRGS